MRISTRNAWMMAGVAATGLALLVGAGVAAGDDERKVHKSKVRVVTTDDDGNTHHEEFEFDGDEPRAFLGVSLERAKDGVAIREVIEGTAAERAGLRQGDVIVGIDGREVSGPWDVTRAVLQARPGDVVDIEVLRDGRSQIFSAELGERAHGHVFGLNLDELEERMERLHEQLEDMEFDFDFDFDQLPNFDFGMHGRHRRPVLGVQLTEMTPELREHLGAPADAGVLVAKVLPGMPAETAGVRVGDVILAVDGREIEDAGDLVRALRHRETQTVRIDLVRDGLELTLDAVLPEPEEIEESRRPARIRHRVRSPADRV